MGQGEEGSGANPAWLLPLSPTTTIHATGPIYLVDASSLGGPLAQQLFARQRRGGGAFRPGRRLALQGLLLAALLTVALLSFFEPHLRDGLAQALLRAGAGRGPPPARDLDFPVQSCCIGQQCVRNSKGRHAVVTHVHSQREVTQLLQLEASMRRSNPSVDLAVMLVRGQLGAAATQRILDLGLTMFYVEPLARQYGSQARSASHSWLKLRAFGLTQYDAVLLVDSNAYITGDIAPLFSLPTDFAAGWDQARWLGGNDTAVHAVSGGALFLRPCAATEAHMLDILARPKGGAAAAALPRRAALPGQAVQGAAGVEQEQDFLAWYFQYTGATLPFDVYVINMDGAAARLASFQRTFQASDLKAKNFVRFPAVNGSALDASRLVSAKALAEIEAAEAAGYRTKHYQLTRGSVGCYMSHLQLYQHILRETDAQFAFVFEDDAVIEQPGLLAALVEAKPFPEDWDIVMLGHYCHSCPAVAGAPRYRAAHSFFGTHSYVVHRRGLQKIFAFPRLMPIEKQIDAVLGDMCQQGLLNVYALAQPLVEQNSKEFRSTIQLPVKRRLGVNPYARE
ncbi:hypothetical protein CHLNCDRAFT_133736 [Chlorella variabilis]|uniref:Glycosyl transferase family 25 domain-containing protein n=1 Tax=Chlorella variabilis TaxID=554065 RepID=E1ZF53_CHLVA|nr:hypothetical protein CHLNCDRAFT_133736 [Chlorella variabilis]EFN55609.1 hypothetical protein CHLNCDRAFT_133736 [Chlorella variabilis]|eukprot:XP_005847711.1 hypothetical protein CHLNCDRAFT_133736 [Chlorella variabilis]